MGRRKMKEAAQQALLIVRMQESTPRKMSEATMRKMSASQDFASTIVKRARQEAAELATTNSRREAADKRYRQNKKVIVETIYRRLRHKWQEKTTLSLQGKMAAQNFGVKK